MRVYSQNVKHDCVIIPLVQLSMSIPDNVVRLSIPHSVTVGHLTVHTSMSIPDKVVRLSIPNIVTVGHLTVHTFFHDTLRLERTIKQIMSIS